MIDHGRAPDTAEGTGTAAGAGSGSVAGTGTGTDTGALSPEFQTLHRLAARDDRRATPGELAAELLLSPAGITGRLDALEHAGLVRRIRGTADRRRVDVELTDAGHAKWLAGMRFQDEVERQIVGALDERERARVNALLKKMLLRAEELAAGDSATGGS